MKIKIVRKIGYHDNLPSQSNIIKQKFGPKSSIQEIRNAAARICRDYLTGRWKVVSADELIVKRISGGLSNFLYYIALPEIETNSESVRPHEDNNGNEKNLPIHINADEAFGELDDVGITGNVKKRRRTDSGSSVSGGSDGQLVAFSTRHQAKKLSSCNEPKQVLLRIYGQSHGEDALEAMITESVVFALLSERNFGPKLHGIFPGGRIEQYIPARALVTLELSIESISQKIAEKMGEIHSLNIPMSKEPDWIWNCMHRWLTSARSILKNDNLRNRENSDLVYSLDFDEECKWLKSVVDADGHNFPVLFCHNDMQEGNILYMENNSPQKLRDEVYSIRTESESEMSLDGVSPRNREEVADKRSEVTQINTTSTASSTNNNNDRNLSQASYEIQNEIDNTRDSVLSGNSFSFTTAEEDCEQDTEPHLMIIDFEYCAYNYRGFDLANHFLEWTFDYTNPEAPFYHHLKSQYPTEQQRRLFIIRYLQKLNASIPDYMVTEEEIAQLQFEVRIFSMFSHLFWSLWSIVNLTSNIEFGYWDYAITRIQEYQKLKEEFLNREDSDLSKKSLNISGED